MSEPRVRIEPDTFTLVEFDRDDLTATVETLLDAIGLDRPVVLEIDQTSPLGEARVVSIEPEIRLFCESGALENPKKLRQLSPTGRPTCSAACCSGCATASTPTSATRPPTPTSASSGRRRGTSTASVASCASGSATRTTASAACTSSAPGTASPTRPTRAFEQLWTGDGLTWADVERLSEDGPRRRSDPDVVGRDRVEQVDLGRTGQQPPAPLGELDHVGGVEVGALRLR